METDAALELQELKKYVAALDKRFADVEKHIDAAIAAIDRWKRETDQSDNCHYTVAKVAGYCLLVLLIVFLVVSKITQC